MNRSRRRFLCVPLLAAIPAAAAHAAPLTMAVVDLMPWAGRNAAGQLEGAAVDLAPQLSALTGRPITAVAVPYPRAIAMLANGGADLMLAIEADSRHGLPPPLASLGTEDIILVGRRGTAWAGPEALCGRKVGLLRSASFDALLRPSPCLLRYETNSYEQGLRMLRQGRLDAMAGVRASMEYAIRRLGLVAADFGPPLLVGQAGIALYLAPRSATPALTARLQQACAQLAREKQMPALLAQYRHIAD